MARKCSHCGRIGHNSRTCNIYINKLGVGAAVSRSTTSTSHHPTNSIDNITSNLTTPSVGGPKLFGIQLTNNNNLNPSSSFFSNNNNFSCTCGTITAIRKSFSLDSFHPACCTTASSPSSSSKSLSPSSSFCNNSNSRIHVDEILDYRSSSAIGYLSDELITRSQERKKGVPWTEEEHRTFVIGLEKLGKGDWRGISKKFVPTRTPTQVASHAQKYFLRQATLNKKRRSSLFDDTIGSARIGGGEMITSIFPNMNITAAAASSSHSFQGSSSNCKTSLRHGDELTHVEQFHHHLPRYNNNSLGGSYSPTRPTVTVPPRPTGSSVMVISDQHQNQAALPDLDLDLQLTLRVPGLPPANRSESSSKHHPVLVGTV